MVGGKAAFFPAGWWIDSLLSSAWLGTGEGLYLGSQLLKVKIPGWASVKLR